MNRFIKEVFDAHELIQRWFSDAAAPQSVGDQLLARFSPAYSMVTLSGQQLDYPALCAFFAARRGAAVGLQIDVEHLVLIAEGVNHGVVTYQERQQLPGQNTTFRFSTVVFELDPRGKVLWRHLHETEATDKV